MNKEEVRQLLNNQSSKLFDDIVNSRVLGANNHIRMIGEIMLLTAEDESENGKSVLYNSPLLYGNKRAAEPGDL